MLTREREPWRIQPRFLSPFLSIEGHEDCISREAAGMKEGGEDSLVAVDLIDR